MREEIQQLQQSHSAKHARKSGGLVLFLVTLEQANVLTEKLMQDFCGGDALKVLAKHLQHYESGSEVLMLQHLYTFCSHHLASQVTFLHNNFHYVQSNENWRLSPP